MTKNCGLTILSPLLFGLFLHGQVSLVQANPDSQDSGSQRTTQQEDENAIRLYQAAASQLKNVSLQNKKSGESIPVLERLGETLFKMATIQYRLVFGSGSQSYKAQQNKSYQETLTQLVQTESILVQKLAQSPQLPRHLFLLGSAYKELKDVPNAMATLKSLIDKHPDASDSVNAHFLLHDLLSKSKDYTTAITYLSKLKPTPNDRYFGTYLDNLAFDYFYLNNHSQALSFLEKKLAFLTSRPELNIASERLKILKNCTLFYFSAIDQKVPGFLATEFIPYLRKLNVGPDSAKALKYFSNLLRSKGKYSEIEEIKKQLGSGPTLDSQALSFIGLALDKEVQLKEFKLIQETSQLIENQLKTVGLKELPQAEVKEFQEILYATLKQMQSLYHPESPDASTQEIGKTLTSLYTILLKSHQDPKLDQEILYNLGEIYFQQKDYDRAFTSFQFSIKHKIDSDTGKKLTGKAWERLIEARYQTFLAKALIPAKLDAKALSLDRSEPIPESIQQWIRWTKTLYKEPTKAGSDFYHFEIARLLYSSQHIALALAELSQFTKTYYTSKHYSAAASLIIDTYILSENWDQAYQTVQSFLNDKNAKDLELKKILPSLAATVYFKKIESKHKLKKYDEVLKDADFFITSFKGSIHVSDCLALAGNAALALNDKKRALSYFDPLSKLSVTDALKGTILITKAVAAEDAYNFESATREYMEVLRLPSGKQKISTDEIKKLRIKTLFLAWISGNPTLLKEITLIPGVCADSLLQQCQTFLFLTQSDPRSSQNGTLALFNKLQSTQPMHLTERALLITKSIEAWSQLEPRVQYAFLIRFTKSIDYQLSAASKDVEREAPVQLGKASLQHRIKTIETLEKTFEKVLELPWSTLRVITLNHWANLYSNFSMNITRLPKPTDLKGEDLKTYENTILGLKAPFEQKGSDLRKKALETAISHAVEVETLAPLIASLQTLDPSLLAKEELKRLEPIDSTLYPLLVQHTDIERKMKSILLSAIQQKNWPKLGFLITELETKRLLNAPQISVLKAVSLGLVGAQAESVGEMMKALPALKEGSLRNLSYFFVSTAFYGIRNKEKVKAILNDLTSKPNTESLGKLLTPKNAKRLLEIAHWTKAELPASLIKEITQ